MQGCALVHAVGVVTPVGAVVVVVGAPGGWTHVAVGGHPVVVPVGGDV